MSAHDRCLKEVAARPHCARFRRDAALETQSRKLAPRTPSRAPRYVEAAVSTRPSGTLGPSAPAGARQTAAAAAAMRPTGTPAGRMEACTGLRSGQQQRSAEGDECDADRDRGGQTDRSGPEVLQRPPLDPAPEGEH